MRSWCDEDERCVALAECVDDRLVLQPGEELRATLLGLWIACAYASAPGAPKEATRSWRVVLGPWHWAIVRPILPSLLVAHVEAELPGWLAWIEREEGFRARRPADPLQEVADRQESLFGGTCVPEDPDHPWFRLYPYQRVGVRWAYAVGGRGVIGDQMGVGKTPLAWGFLESNAETRRALVICPGSVLVNWVREGERWAPSWTASVAWSTKDVRALARATEERPDRHATIVSWGLVSRPEVAADLLRAGFDAVIADEAHNAKNIEAARTRHMLALMHEARVRLPLTGTPIKNRPEEFWTLLHAVDPIRFHSFYPWGETFCGPRDRLIGLRSVRTYSGSSRLPQLARLTTPYVLRREKMDVLTELPPKTRQVLPLRAPSELVEETEHLLRRIREQPKVGGMEAGQALGQLGQLRMKIGLAKVESAAEWAIDAHASGEPVVLFTYHHEVAVRLYEVLERAGLRVGRILGDTPARARQSIVDAFQSGRLDALIGSEAMKEGVNLVRAALSLQVEWWWAPGDLEQAEDRLSRNGQLRPVTNVYLQLLKTLDDYMAVLIEDKRGVVQGSLARDMFHKSLLHHLAEIA